jgi:hypothetical protein
MKPEIVVPSLGALNARLSSETIRMADSGLWKKQRIVVVLPAAEDIPTRVALAQWNLIFPPNQSVIRLCAMGMEVGAAYSETLKWILAHEELRSWEYVLTVEHDNVPPPDGVLRLIAQMEAHPELAAISGLYWTKGEGGVPQICGDTTDPVLNFRPQTPREGQLVECNGIGMGFALWRMTAFKTPGLPDPLFKTKAGVEGVGTQDLAFWGEARKLGLRCAVDCAVLVGHYDKGNDFTW